MGDDEIGQGPTGNPYEHLDVPGKSELSVSELLARIEQRIRRARQERIPWSSKEVREELVAEADYQQLNLRGPIEVAKGQEPVLAVNSQQSEALRILFDIGATEIILTPHYASIQATGKENPETVEVRVKYVSMNPSTINHLVISEGLANKLGITSGGADIKVTNVYQRISDIDLDNIR